MENVVNFMQVVVRNCSDWHSTGQLSYIPKNEKKAYDYMIERQVELYKGDTNGR